MEREKVVFEHTMASLLKLLGSPTGLEHFKPLREMGVDQSKPLLPAYPVEVYAAVVDYVVRQRWPGLQKEQAYHEMGRAFLDSYTETGMGGALKVLVRVLGPHRTLERMQRNFRSANNYTETKLERQGPTAYEVWFNEVARPEQYRGMLTRALELAGARELKVELRERRGLETTYRVTWVE
jgi:uncharacterized protein (TIGR02265 family)